MGLLDLALVNDIILEEGLLESKGRRRYIRGGRDHTGPRGIDRLSLLGFSLRK
jgi:hypothetical protein